MIWQFVNGKLLRDVRARFGQGAAAMSGGQTKASPGSAAARLKALRERLGLTRGAMGAVVGKDADAYGHYERRYKGDLLPPELQPLLQFLTQKGVDRHEAETLFYAQPRPLGVHPHEVRPALHAPSTSIAAMPMDVPVLGSAQGGVDGFIEMGGEPVDRVRRAPGIASNRNVFALYINGDSMEPRFQSGELIYVNPNRQPRVGDYVVVEFKPLLPHDPWRALVKRLVRRTATRLVLSQCNPACEMEFATDEVLRVSYVMTTNDLFGV